MGFHMLEKQVTLDKASHKTLQLMKLRSKGATWCPRPIGSPSCRLAVKMDRCSDNRDKIQGLPNPQKGQRN